MESIERVHRFLPWVAVALLLVGGCSREPPAPPKSAAGEETLTREAFMAQVQRLAADDFEGRKPASEAEPKVIEYISGQFKAAGLKPGNGDSYVQEVPMVEITPTTGMVLKVARGKQVRELKYGDEMLVWTKRVQPQVSLQASELVFVGYGIVAPEYRWNDYAGIDMKGKTAVILVNDPGFVTGDPQLFDGKAMTYHGRWTYKFEEASRQGAAGAIIIHETAPAAYGWEVVRSSWSGPQLDKYSEDGNAGRVGVEGWITHDSAQALFKLAGLDLPTLEKAAVERGFKPVPMKLQASVSIHNTIRRSQSHNVIGILPGSKRPQEYVFYTGHWDHLGRNPQLQGDQIFNGAVDNATGTAGLILMAKAFASVNPAPERSVVFLALTGEESGLLGSAYYADHPIFPLEHTAAVLNMDALYEGSVTKDVDVIGYGASDLDELLRTAARAQQRRVEPDPTPEKGSFYRSDHFNFAKKGVPALYIKQGVDAVEGGLERGRAAHEDYVKNRYHSVADEYRPDMDFGAALEDLRLLYSVGYGVAQTSRWPNWYEGKEFRAKRDESAAARN